MVEDSGSPRTPGANLLFGLIFIENCVKMEKWTVTLALEENHMHQLGSVHTEREWANTKRSKNRRKEKNSNIKENSFLFPLSFGVNGPLLCNLSETAGVTSHQFLISRTSFIFLLTHHHTTVSQSIN